ncbi:hypothetical protein FACS189413_04360 [Bacteroidia bacterium]|nr:hypothetical protein FACS189413_04360 [Bacteroidia bacterium]
MLMDKELECDFVFGDTMSDVKKMDYSLLFHFKKEVRNRKLFRRFTWQQGVVPLLRENYTHYIMLGDVAYLSTWAMIILARVFGKKMYLWSHGWYGKESKLRLLITKFLFFNLPTGIFLYGNYARSLMIEAGLDARKLHVIYNSLDYDTQIEIRRNCKSSPIYERYFQNSHKTLIFVGRLTKVKRLDILLHAVSELNKMHLKFNLVLIGTGEMQHELISLTNELKIKEYVWFYGASYNEKELSELIYNADLCVAPGNVGLTAIHSMTYGTPVVTHNNFPYQMPEFEAIEKGITGNFFEYNDGLSLVETIQKWFEKDPDRNFIREKCYEVIDTKYNPHVQLETIKSVLNDD